MVRSISGKEGSLVHFASQVFQSGSMLASRRTLQLLEQALVAAHSWPMDPPVRNKENWPKHIPIKSSPLSSITLGDQSRLLSGIPNSAVFFCCSYPVVHEDEAVPEIDADGKPGIDADGTPRQFHFKKHFKKLLCKSCEGTEDDNNQYADGQLKLLEGDPFYMFLTVGALIYFDIEYRIIAINCFSFNELEPGGGIEQRERETNTKLSRKLYFGRKSVLPSGAIRPLAQYERWEKVSVELIRNVFGFTHYSWIKPSEFLGDHVFPKNGGFAYLDESSRTGIFYPIITPHAVSAAPRHHCHVTPHRAASRPPYHTR